MRTPDPSLEPPPRRRQRCCARNSAMLTTLVTLALVGSGCTTALLFIYSEEVSDDLLRLKDTLRRRRRSSSSTPLPSVDPNCTDSQPECDGWALAGECNANPAFMKTRCRRSCGICGRAPAARRGAAVSSDCEDKSGFCGEWAAVGECDSNPVYMRSSCPVTCHLCQSKACHDEEPSRCAAEAERGLCRAEPERMYRECRWACKWCAMQTSSRCRRDAKEQPALANLRGRVIARAEDVGDDVAGSRQKLADAVGKVVEKKFEP